MNKIRRGVTDADLDNALDLPFLIVRKIAISYWKPERESQCLFGTIHAFFHGGCFLMKKEKGFALLLFGILIAKGNFWYVGLVFGIIGLFIVLIH
ncbi:MAG: hypothetical protein HP049_01295 [Clostridiales bacterium]|nr:hypothetical protein [Clostridiales bacterium]